MKKYIKTLYIFAIIFMALSLVSCHNKSKDTELEQENDEYYESDVYEEEYEESSYDPIGDWRLVPIYNEFREKTDNMMARINFKAFNNAPEAIYDGQVNILYIPNYGFEIHDYGDGSWGWDELKVRDDYTDEFVDIKYHSRNEVNNKYHSKDDSYSSNISYIAIDDPKSVRIFYNLLLSGNITLLLNKNQVCYIHDETRGLDFFIQKNNIDDKYTTKLELEGMTLVRDRNKMKEILEQHNFVYVGKEKEYTTELWLFRGTVWGTPNVMLKLSTERIKIYIKDEDTYQKWLKHIDSQYGYGPKSLEHVDWIVPNGKIIANWKNRNNLDGGEIIYHVRDYDNPI